MVDEPWRIPNVEMIIKLSHLTQPQAIVMKSFMRQLEYAGKIGTSRYYAFFADGDGNFHPKIDIQCPELPNVEYKPTDEREINAHLFDYDGVAWKLREFNNDSKRREVK